MDLDAVEVRVLGCLIEKQRTTPDQYPLSLNALRLACNQSTTGSRLVAWLHASRIELTDSGYWSGVVRCFSIRQPRTRSSTGSRSMGGSVTL